jgi:type III restriction enzyme
MLNRFSEYTVNYISNVMTLRKPQAESLALLEEILSQFELKKDGNLAEILQKVHSVCPICTDFEREFPSLTYALATGVGKTRLMGACVTYLYASKGICNFFVVAPNLTVYNKLIDDFSKPQTPKYVFKGIGIFAQNKPRIITGDNYREQVVGQTTLNESVTINIFNISKINSETRGGKEPLMKRLSEYIGQSYFDFLAAQNDLVLLMDESHHYRAERGMTVLNELKPVLGLEMTATPIIETNKGSVKFKNVVYDYPLARALHDGYVKVPAVATRRDFDPHKHTDSENDRLKLEDGIRIHEDTKVALEIFARDNHVNSVKPFALVVAKDTTHAAEIMEKIQSDIFFGGRYKDKVMQIDSKQTGEEKTENIEKLLTLENPDNKIEIVIHVNMLKEGWDVTNLYTIIPLRAAASMTLREQTIGRGLRLPFGERTGNSKVDRLTIVAHDRFQEIVDAANKADSIIRKENIIEINDVDLKPKEVVTSVSKAEEKLFGETPSHPITMKDILAQSHSEDVKENPEIKARVETEMKKIIYSAVNEIGKSLTDVNDIKKPEIKAQIIVEAERLITPELRGIFNLYDIYTAGFIEKFVDIVIETIEANTIEIPRMSILRSQEVKCGFHDFELDIENIHFQPVDKQIVIKNLLNNNSEFLSAEGEFLVDSLPNLIVSGLIDKSDIDYSKQADLLYKLAGQLLKRLNSYLNEHEVENVMLYFRNDIVSFIYQQMKEHFYIVEPPFLKPKVYPFQKIEEHNNVHALEDKIYDFNDTVKLSEIRSLLFTGFKKALHTYYSFDSNTEKKMAILLEDDTTVLRWLRPSKKQFNIYWDRTNSEAGRYVPDFVVETHNAIYMVETKARKDMTSEEVIKKKNAALLYCKNATEYNLEHGKKPWKYVLIPHDENILASSVEVLFGRYKEKSLLFL